MDYSKKIEIKAHDLFTRYGIQNTSLDEIATELCIDKVVILDFFENKDALVENFVQSAISQNKEFCKALTIKSDNAIVELFYMMTYSKSLYETLNNDIINDLKKKHKYAYGLLNRHKSGFLYQTIKNILQRGIDENLYRYDFNINIVGKLILENVIMISTADILWMERPIEEMFRFLAAALVTSAGREILELHESILFDKPGTCMVFK